MTPSTVLLSNVRLDLALHRIPDPTSTGDQAERLIQKAIISMKMLVREIDNDPDFIHVHSTTLRNAWPGIWGWTNFIHRQCVIELNYGEALRHHALRAIPAIITALGRQLEPGLHSLISNTSGILELITPYWLQEDVNDKSYFVYDTGYAANFSTALNFLLPLDHDRTHLLSLVVNSTEGAELGVARVAVSHARAAFLCGDRDYDNSAVTHLALIFKFLQQDCPGLKLAMFKEGSMEAVIRILDMTAGEESPGAVDTLAIKICYEILSRALTVACSLTFITQGLDVGLLQAMLRGGRHLSEPGIVKTALYCFKQVHQLMVYRSFLRSLGKAVKKIDGNSVDEHTSGPLWNAWLGLKVAAAERLKDMNIFDVKEIDGECVSTCQRRVVS
jgi:hypothetical protein